MKFKESAVWRRTLTDTLIWTGTHRIKTCSIRWPDFFCCFAFIRRKHFNTRAKLSIVLTLLFRRSVCVFHADMNGTLNTEHVSVNQRLSRNPPAALPVAFPPQKNPQNTDRRPWTRNVNCQQRPVRANTTGLFSSPSRSSLQNNEAFGSLRP